jgi:hypothetical protein
MGSNVVFGSSTATYTDVQTRIVDPQAGTDSLSIGSGLTVSFPAAATGGLTQRYFSSLTLGAGSRLVVPTTPNRGGRTLLVVQAASLAAAATLDLGGNDADFITASLATVNGWVKTGYNETAGANWSGTGIDSSYAAADSTHLTALAVVQNNQGGSPLFSSTNLFDGTAPGTGDVLVKYTYYGDANLSGKVDGSDYSLIDAGYKNTAKTGWYNGDFNYDGVVDGTDYTLIDNAFNGQGLGLSPAIDFSTGFGSYGSGLTLNGNASVSSGQLQLTQNAMSQTSSAFYSTPVSVTRFNAIFTFSSTAYTGSGDGFAFVIQNAGPTALGGPGGQLGYAGIGSSIAIKFDLYNNAGEGSDSTGLYEDGAVPENVGSVDLSATGINLHSGDPIQANITYNGSTLVVLLTDTVTGATATQSYAVNIASVVGAKTAYFGFTGATGAASSAQAVSGWTVFA